MPQFYIAEQSQLKSKLQSLSAVGEPINQWTQHYKDVITAEEWMLCTPNPEAGPQAVLLLKRWPLLNLEEVIQLALFSSDRNNIAGAIFDLLHREKTEQADFRMTLIHALRQFIQQPMRNRDKERVKLIIHQCKLLDARNLRQIVGKHVDEIEKDAAYFKLLPEEAGAIIREIQPGV